MENQPPQSIKDDDKADVVTKVRENLSKVASGTVRVEAGSKQGRKPSIYKIPEFIKKVQPEAFKPRLVSFGPYYHGESHLASMESKKLAVFYDFHMRYRLNIGFIVESVWSILKELQESYDMLEKKWKVNPDTFLELMIVDGCFILEFFYNCSESLQNMRAEIKLDMLLLENQLPMKLLHMLCSMANIKEPLLERVQLQYFNWMTKSTPRDETQNFLHILDMYMAVLLLPWIDKDQTGSPSEKNVSKSVSLPIDQCNIEYQVIRHATHLHESGIKFEKGEKMRLRDVSFKEGVLRLPHMVLDHDTEPTFLNMMAFEKLHIEAGEVTSFILLMDNLIDVGKDVSLLASKGILSNGLGDDHAAAKLFNLLAKGVTMNLNSHMATMCKDVNDHCSKKLNKWSAALQHNYFKNPWTIISLIAAFLGIAILILQTVYQICDYY